MNTKAPMPATPEDPMPINPKVKTYLKTLRRIPDDVVLRMATREFTMVIPNFCVCGWAIREMLANGVAAEDIQANYEGNKYISVPYRCGEIFGGTFDEWFRLFYAVTDAAIVQNVEEAFVLRVAECAA